MQVINMRIFYCTYSIQSFIYYACIFGMYGRWCPSFIRDCGHNQDKDPFYVEKPVVDTTDLDLTVEHIKRKRGEEGDGIKVVSSADPSAPAKHKRRRDRDRDLLRHTEGTTQRKRKSFRRKRNYRPVIYDEDTADPDPALDGILPVRSHMDFRFKSNRARYQPSVSGADYEKLLQMSDAESEGEEGEVVVTSTKHHE